MTPGDSTVETVLETFSLWNAGDMDGLRELYHPDAVMHHPRGWPEPGPSIGRESVFAQFETLREDWDTDQLNMEVRASNDEWAVLDVTWATIGRTSGAGTELRMAFACRVGGDLITEVHIFWELSDALEAAGLSTP